MLSLVSLYSLLLICLPVIKISPREVFLLHFSRFFFTRWLGLIFGFGARAGPSNHESGWDLGQMGLKDFLNSLCEEINRSSLPFKDSIQHWFPFLHCNLPMTLWDFEVSRWEIVICIFMFLPFGKSTGLLFVFKVHLLPNLSCCPFFPSSLLPFRQHMSHSRTGFISSSLSSSLFLRIAPACRVPVYADWTCCFRCRQNVDQLQFTSKQWTESRADSPLLFSSQSPSLNPWFLTLILSFRLHISSSCPRSVAFLCF